MSGAISEKRLLAAKKKCKALRLLTKLQFVRTFWLRTSVVRLVRERRKSLFAMLSPSKESSARLVRLARKLHDVAGLNPRLSDTSWGNAARLEGAPTRFLRRFTELILLRAIRGDASLIELSARSILVKSGSD